MVGLRPQIKQITSALGLGFTIALDFGGFNRIIEVNLGLVKPLLLLTSKKHSTNALVINDCVCSTRITFLTIINLFHYPYQKYIGILLITEILLI